MTNSILVPLDTTRAAEHVLPVVVALAKALGRPVLLLTVVPDGTELQPVLKTHDAEIAGLLQQRQQRAQQYLEGVRSRLAGEGLTVECEVALGNVADRIGEYASQREASMVAMTTHGRAGMQRWFLGSVADRVVRTVTLPVLLVRPPEEGTPSVEGIKHVLVPLDGSALAEEALPAAREIATACGLPIMLLRAVPMDWILSTDAFGVESEISPQLLETIEQETHEYLDRVAGGLRGAGFDVEAVFAPYTHPADDIVRLAEEAPGTLVVMTTHGRSGMARTVLGSVTDRVIRSSAAPVLVVRGTASA